MVTYGFNRAKYEEQKAARSTLKGKPAPTSLPAALEQIADLRRLHGLSQND